MGRILVLLSLLFSFSAIAASPGNAPVLTIAASGQNTQSLSVPLSSLSGTGVDGVFSLYGFVASSGAGNVYPLYKNGSAYQVTTGVKAYCSNITAGASTGGVFFQLVSSTASFGQAGSLTGGVYMGGASAIYPLLSGTTVAVQAPVPGSYTFNALTFPGYQTAGATAYFIHMDCYEK